ncbi:MAG: thiol:disulfide interchange protein/DsbC/DsbD-like thiol-disulfide interchange protein [Flavobacterium sp.]
MFSAIRGNSGFFDSIFMKNIIPLKFVILLVLAQSLFSSFCVGANPLNVDAELVSEYTAVEPGQTFTVLLKTKIRDGWHTYWKNPGDSGAPTNLMWHLPEGWVAGEIQWPYPERIPYGPLVNFGYEGEVSFPVDITIASNQKTGPITLKADVEWLVCADICIPEDKELSLDLLIDRKTIDQSTVMLFQSAREKLPKAMGLISKFFVEEEKLTLNIEMPGLRRERIKQIAYFPYQEGVMDSPAEQELSLVEGGFELVTQVGYDYSLASDFSGIIVIEENAGGQGSESNAGIELTTAFEVLPINSEAVSSEGMSLLLAVAFAFIGGLILNLMPCVFPVLSIKILSLIQETNHVRTHGWVYFTGVVSSFVAIAVILIALRASGAEIGWGFQLQSPFVVAILAYLFLLIALNLSGYFEIGTNIMSFGQTFTQKGYLGSFLTGVLATVVAAPCTAPFMASAIGFALTQSNLDALLIFASLGTGMAAPYLLLCYSPYLLEKLPRPGAWMERMKELLAFPLYASAVWLAWVLSIQSGSTGVLYWGAGAVSLVFAIWLLKHLPSNLFGRLSSQFFAILLISSAVYLGYILPTIAKAASQESKSESSFTAPEWEAYSEKLLTQYRREGPVFVDFDAAWCITCKVNAAVAIDTPEVKSVFEKHHVRYLKGDWTNEDPAITRKLSEYGRSGVPLYLLYKDSENRAVVLPQILTKNIILDAVEQLVESI